MINNNQKRAFVGITGASGTVYGERIIKALLDIGMEVHASITEGGLLNAETEYGQKFFSSADFFRKLAMEKVFSYEETDKRAAPASGSFRIDHYIFAPASMGFIGRAAGGISSNLIERAADVALKEKKTMALLFREAPLSSIHLENLLRLANAGAAIIPAAPAFYNKPASVDDLINFTAGKVLDILKIDNNLYNRWE